MQLSYILQLCWVCIIRKFSIFYYTIITHSNQDANFGFSLSWKIIIRKNYLNQFVRLTTSETLNEPSLWLSFFQGVKHTRCVTQMKRNTYLSVIVFPQPAHSCWVAPFLPGSLLLPSIVILSSTTWNRNYWFNHHCTIETMFVVFRYIEHMFEFYLGVVLKVRIWSRGFGIIFIYIWYIGFVVTISENWYNVIY